MIIELNLQLSVDNENTCDRATEKVEEFAKGLLITVRVEPLLGIPVPEQKEICLYGDNLPPGEAKSETMVDTDEIDRATFGDSNQCCGIYWGHWR